MEKENLGYDVGVISVMLLGATTRPNPQSTRGRGSPGRCPPMLAMTPTSRQIVALLGLQRREHRRGGPGNRVKKPFAIDRKTAVTGLTGPVEKTTVSHPKPNLIKGQTS
jgi:hypothetical protein